MLWKFWIKFIQNKKINLPCFRERFVRYMNQNFNYIDNLLQYKRQVTSLVRIGSVTMGACQPILIQSMTDTDTNDTEATVNQIIRIIDAGADLVRVTVQGIREAENLTNITSELARRGYHQPLCADIHFNPAAAEIAIRNVAKVRINPGNFYDKRAVFVKVNYTDDEYRLELKKIEERFIPFIRDCKAHGTALRIGANQGSLSDRIMSRYGGYSCRNRRICDGVPENLQSGGLS